MPTRSNAPAVLASLALLACASARRPAEEGALPSRPPADTGSIGRTDGRSMETLFAGRFPGLTVLRTGGGGLQLRIRGGSNTFYGSDEPLILIDDVPSGSHGIVFLNPSDIQNIQVLKNPADIALYGVRGSNGVIKITTRKAGRP